MTREEIQKEAASLKGNNWLFEMATSSGKSKAAIDKVKSLYNKEKGKTLLITVPRNVLKTNWDKEIKKWWPNNNLNITYTTYVSFPKYKGHWDYCIMDEAHHLSERCRCALCDFDINHTILLSATVGKNLKDELREVFDDLVVYKKDLRDLIDDGILPEPRVFLWPLELLNKFPTETIIKNPKAKGSTIETCWAERWKFMKQKNFPVKIYCTEEQYYYDLSSQINFWKRRTKVTRNEIFRNKWLKLCNDRLKWLSDKKVKYIHQLSPILDKYRTLIFCKSIEQTELCGENCINSKNEDSDKIIQDFNNGLINHITACAMLNEGINLFNCQVGIYNNLDGSTTPMKQRLGRILRHPNPILIIPYFKNTREEEILQKMLEDYNPDMVTEITSLEEIQI